MAPQIALRRGVPAPQQSTPTTCGSACLEMARMLADGRYAEQVRARGFEREELRTRNRTSGLLALLLRGRAPWPRALGTPPWAAALELARSWGVPPRRVRWRVIRWGSRADREQLLAGWSTSLSPDRPALLYVGSRLLPRHVTLVVPAADGAGFDVYEPSAGDVVELDTGAFARGRVDLAGWTVPWLVVGVAP